MAFPAEGACYDLVRKTRCTKNKESMQAIRRRLNNPFQFLFSQPVHSIGNPLRPITKEFITIDELVKENHMFSYFPYFASPQAVIDIDSSVSTLALQSFPDLIREQTEATSNFILVFLDFVGPH